MDIKPEDNMLAFLAFTAILIIFILILKNQPFFELFSFARFKGKIGEIFVANIFDSHLPKDKYTVIHNIKLPAKDGRTQIDHIIFSKKTASSKIPCGKTTSMPKLWEKFSKWTEKQSFQLWYLSGIAHSKLQCQKMLFMAKKRKCLPQNDRKTALFE